MSNESQAKSFIEDLKTLKGEETFDWEVANNNLEDIRGFFENLYDVTQDEYVARLFLDSSNFEDFKNNKDFKNRAPELIEMLDRFYAYTILNL